MDTYGKFIERYNFLKSYGYKIPDFGTIPQLAGRHSKDTEIVVFSDTVKFMTCQEAMSRCPLKYAAVYAPKNGECLRIIQIGYMRYTLKFKNVHWKITGGECELVSEMKYYHPELPLPYFMLDCTNEEKRVHFNIQEDLRLRNTPIAAKLTKDKLRKMISSGVEQCRKCYK